MNGWLVGSMLGLGLAATGIWAVQEVAAADPKEPVWWTDYANAQAAARQTGKPLLVVFR